MSKRKTSEISLHIPTLKRPNAIPKDQQWFWTSEWQKGENEVNEALRNGAFEVFDTIEDAVERLHQKR